MEIRPFNSLGSLRFGQSDRSDCVACYGEPKVIRTNHEGIEEFHYKRFIFRFDSVTNLVRECTLLPKASATIDGIKLTWDNEFLRKACDRDGNAKNVYGFIVLNNLGIAITGLHDKDKSQLAVTAFSRGDFDDLLVGSSPFEAD